MATLDTLEQFAQFQERVKTIQSRLAIAQSVTAQRLQSKRKLHEQLVKMIADFCENHEKHGPKDIQVMQDILSSSGGLVYLSKRSFQAYQQTLAVIDHPMHFPYIRQILQDTPELVKNDPEFRPIAMQYYNILKLAEVIRKHIISIIPVAEQQYHEAEAFGNDMGLINLDVYLRVTEVLERQIAMMEKELQPIVYSIKATAKELSRMPDKAIKKLGNRRVQLVLASGLMLSLIGPALLQSLGVATEGQQVMGMFSELSDALNGLDVVQAVGLLTIAAKSSVKI